MAVGLDLQNQLDKPDGLHRLPECSGTLIGNLGADAAELQQFLPSCAVRLLLCQLLRQLGIAVRKNTYRVNHRENCVVKDILVKAVRVGKVQGLLAAAGALLVTPQTLLQNPLVIHRQVGITGVQLALHAEDTGFHEHIHGFWQQCLSPVPEGVVVPEGGNGAQLVLGLLGDVEHIPVPLFKQVQLLQYEAHGILRENGGIFVLGCLIACNQSFVLDVDGHIFQDGFQHPGPDHDSGLVLILPVGLGGQNRTLGIHIGLFIQNLLPEGLHPGCEGAEGVQLHNVPPFNFIRNFICLRL